jgi:hypothetical protein
MAPEWARASRPLVVVFMAIAFVVTLIFNADVDAQGGAYATGVLFLMTSAAVAVTIAHWHTPRRWGYALMTVIFAYTTVANIIERPEGIKIATWFIVTIVASSLISRVMRSTEIRLEGVDYDEAAMRFVRDAASKTSAEDHSHGMTREDASQPLEIRIAVQAQMKVALDAARLQPFPGA